MELKNWYHVTFDEKGITRNVDPPEKESWTDFVPWDRIIRICFKSAEYFLYTDEIYIFTKDRPESYLIPMDADGGGELWDEFINRGLFDAKLAIETASAGEDELFCWPPENRGSEDKGYFS